MNEILFISFDYMPMVNGTVSCLSNFMPLLSKDRKITVLTKQLDFKQKKKEESNNISIYRLTSIFDYLVMYIEKINLNVLKRILRLFFAPIYLLSIKYGYFFLESWGINSYKYILKKNHISKMETIITLSMPDANIRSAVEIKKKHPNVNLIIIQFDLFSYNPVLLNKFPNEFDKRFLEEKSWYNISDKIFVTSEVYNVIKETKLIEFSNKIEVFDLPILKKQFTNEKYKLNDQKNIKLLYTGVFYTDIRNPEFLLEVFQNVIKNSSNIDFDIIGYGCEKILNKYSNDINILGKKDKLFTDNYIQNADILINLSNNTNTQLPSKIIEYISTGKPIINFFKIDDDLCNKVLENYPLKLLIRENSFNIKIISENIIEFINHNYKKRVPSNFIQNAYKSYSPEFFVEKLEKYI